MNAPLAFIPGMQGGTEILVVLFVILLLFGGKKLPELARSLGKSLGEFKKGQREGHRLETEETDEKKEIPENDVKQEETAKKEKDAEFKD